MVITNSFSQDAVRLNTIENKLELLKVEIPGLEEIISINISQTTLSNFLLAISKAHNLNINVSPELNAINIVNNFSEVAVVDILLFLIKEYNLDIDFTGNILSIKKYIAPIKENKEKEILVIYNPSNNLLSLDLKNDKLDKVFRKIMDDSGKNLLYSPDIESKLLSIYINDIPFELALEKLAVANHLEFSISNDGFYVFDSAFEPLVEGGDAKQNFRPIRKKKASFYYEIIDTLRKVVTVDFKNTPISEVIYTIGEDLDLDIFTASPLDNAGIATINAENISFDLLLDKIYESRVAQEEGTGNNPKGTSVNYTYKKEGNIYYFGTENQLSLKHTEVIPMMHRSIELLADSESTGQRRAGRNDFNTNPANFSNGLNQNQNTRNNTSSNSSTSRTNSSSTNNKSIEDLIPDDIKEGLDIRIDSEINSFIVSGSGVKVDRFKNFVTYIDKPVPVILIEVMILEVNRSAIIETGIKFGLGEEPVQTVGEVFPSMNINMGAETVNKVIGSFTGFGALNLGSVLPEFYLNIKAMEENGTIKVLSTPKLSALNGHKANLSSGETTYYAVTTQNLYGSQNPVSSEITNYVPIDAELAIEIRPIVSGDGEITLDIQVIQSAFNGQRVAEDAPPGINSREFSSIIRMRDQDVAILGGIEEVRKNETGSGLPLISRIPVLKWIFGQRRREDTKKNLNILIKPTVIY